MLSFVAMNDKRQYKYVGSKDLKDAIPDNPERYRIQSSQDVLAWIKTTQQRLEYGQVVATFIIDTDKNLYINDRHSEHVLCANGQSVLSAGEITFAIENTEVEVIEITNQSTGYCPEPESWWAVEASLKQTHIPFTSEFTHKFLFRLCENCGTKNIVKDDWFYCGVCDEPLSENWNFD